MNCRGRLFVYFQWVMAGLASKSRQTDAGQNKPPATAMNLATFMNIRALLCECKIRMRFFLCHRRRAG